MNLKNQHNEYQTALGRVFDEIPKAVFAAIACSAYEQLGTRPEELAGRICAEWKALHANGLVQSPTRRCRELAQAWDPLRDDE
jgi:hypothetical protein